MKFRDARNKDKKSKKSVYFVVILIFLMVSSVIGFVTLGDVEQADKFDAEYNGYKFNILNSGYTTKINDRDMYFDYIPGDVIYIEYNKADKLSINQRVYIAFDPEEKSQEMDFLLAKIDNNLKILGYSTNLACILEQNCPDIPLVDCKNFQNVLYLKKYKSDRIYKDNNCIVLEGADINGLSKSTDRFIYSISGVT